MFKGMKPLNITKLEVSCCPHAMLVNFLAHLVVHRANEDWMHFKSDPSVSFLGVYIKLYFNGHLSPVNYCDLLCYPIA